MNAKTLLRAVLSTPLILAVVLTTTSESTLAQPSGYVARVTRVVIWKLSDSEYRAITPDIRASLEARGMKVLDQEQTLQSPELPLSGYWLEFTSFGARRYRTDKEGYVRVSTRPPITNNVKVFAEAINTEVFGVLETVTFVPEGETPSASVLRIPYQMPRNMNPPDGAPIAQGEAGAGRHEDHSSVLRGSCRSISPFPSSLRVSSFKPPQPTTCPTNSKCPPRSNARGCCLDYNGPLGDGERYVRDACTALAIQNFFNSTCFKWTFLENRTPCVSERAILQFEGPACFHNHKFRNCQNMDESDFRVTPATQTVKFGETSRINIRNNTSSNFSALQFIQRPQEAATLVQRGPARLIAWASVPLFADGYTLEHFDTRQHYEDASVTFKAPATPSSAQCSEIYKLRVMAGPQGDDPRDNVTIRVKRSPCGYDFSGLKVEWTVEHQNQGRWEYNSTNSIEFSGRVCGDPKTDTWWLRFRNSTTGRSGARFVTPDVGEMSWRMAPSGVLTLASPGPGPGSGHTGWNVPGIELRFIPDGAGQIRLHADLRRIVPTGFRFVAPSNPTASVALNAREEMPICDGAQ